MFILMAIFIACFAVSVSMPIAPISMYEGVAASPKDKNIAQAHDYTIATRVANNQFFSDGTLYTVGLGAYGQINRDTDFVAAVGHAYFDSFPGYNGANPTTNPICGKQALVHYQGKSVTIRITDRCRACAGAFDLSFSLTAFSQLANTNAGRLHGITWSFV